MDPRGGPPPASGVGASAGASGVGASAGPSASNPLEHYFRPRPSQQGCAPEAPNLPLASPLLHSDVANPVHFPSQDNFVLRTPAVGARSIPSNQNIDFAALGGTNSADFPSVCEHPAVSRGKTPFSDVFGWAWECGSEVGSLPSVWSRASTVRSGSSKFSTGGGGTDGQRLIYIKPQEVRTSSGGNVVIGLRREVPETSWNLVEILLVGGKDAQSMTLKPTGIKKGRKLCVKVPGGLPPRDYDVRVVFGGKILHGAIPLCVKGDDDTDSEN